MRMKDYFKLLFLFQLILACAHTKESRERMANEAVELFESKMHIAKECANPYLAKVQVQRSKLSLSWRIGRKGKAQRITVVKNTMGFVEVEDCFTDYLRTLQFESHPRTIQLSIDYTYSYVKP